MIEVSRLVKTYGKYRAVNDVSFRVDRGEVVGFLGPNGAGKSTTLRILAGFLGMTSGKVRIGGHDIVEASDLARQQIGYMPEKVPLYGEMRVAEYLSFRAELKGVGRRERRDHVERAMNEAHVSHFADTLISNLSKGYTQRVGLADALVSRPPILILDEPTSSLDPNETRDVHALLKEMGKEHTILLSTHILAHVEATCSRAVVIAEGKVVGEGTLDDLRSKRRSSRARIVVRLPDAGADALVGVLKAIPAVHKVQGPEVAGATATVEVFWSKKLDDTAQALEDVIAALGQGGFRVREAIPLRASLDEVFAQLTTEPLPSDDGETP